MLLKMFCKMATILFKPQCRVKAMIDFTRGGLVIWFSIGPGNGLSPDGTNPLPAPVLTNQ